MTKKKHIILGTTLLLLTLLVVFVYHAGNILIDEEQPARADLIVALSGPDRVLYAVDLCPTPYDDFKAAAWWRSREDAKRVVMEYAKWANFYLLDRYR